MPKAAFGEWLVGELEKRGMTRIELARAAGVSRSAITNVINDQRRASAELAEGIARGLNMSPVEVFRRAELLPPDENDGDPTVNQAVHLLQQLEPEDRQIAVDLMEALLRGKQNRRARMLPDSEQGGT